MQNPKEIWWSFRCFSIHHFSICLEIPQNIYPEVISKATMKNVQEEFSSGTLTCLMRKNSFYDSSIWDTEFHWVITAVCVFIMYFDFTGADTESEQTHNLGPGVFISGLPSLPTSCHFVIKCPLYPRGTSTPQDMMTTRHFQKTWGSNLNPLISYALIQSI